MTTDTPKSTSRNPILRILRAPFFSPLGFLIRALAIASVCGLLNLWGLRDYTSVVCGTSPSGNLADKTSILLGMFYAVVYFASYVGAPLFLLAAGILALLERRFADPSREASVSAGEEKSCD
ncbi:MAG TPA: hypothetical protein PLA90_14945 [Candidatus Sumerlaeota bacterium]|nr:hypothetical protein [Candidatus Sumerlaeota bacterium]